MYIDDGGGFLTSGRPLKAIGFYWRRKIAEYKSLLDRNMLKRVKEVGEEYGIDVLLVGEEYTSFLCLLCKTSSRHRRIKRGLFKCQRYGKVFNADLLGAYNILLNQRKSITLSLRILSGVGVTP